MTHPKIYLIYFKNIVELCFREFFDIYGKSFSKDEFGNYVFSKGFDRDGLVRFFEKAVKRRISNMTEPFDVFSPKYYFIIGGCYPKDNMLLSVRRNDFPAKLDKLISVSGDIKYMLKEKDLAIDVGLFNRAVDDVFMKMFMSKRGTAFAVGYPNVFAIRHSSLDCYTIFKIFKYAYGNSVCVNMSKDEVFSGPQCIMAVNDVIRKYTNVSKLNSSREFTDAVIRLKEYADQRISSVLDRRK